MAKTVRRRATFRTAAVLATALLPAALLAPEPAAAEPAAIVLDIAVGSTLAPFAELNIGDVVTLAPDQKADLLDYRLCEEVRVTGGTITVAEEGLAVEGGTVEKLGPGDCGSAALRIEPIAGGASATGSDKPDDARNSTGATVLLRFGKTGKTAPGGAFDPVEATNTPPPDVEGGALAGEGKEKAAAVDVSAGVAPKLSPEG